MQELADMIAMVFHAEFPFDQCGNSPGCPQFCAIAMSHGALEEKLDQLLLLLLR